MAPSPQFNRDKPLVLCQPCFDGCHGQAQRCDEDGKTQSRIGCIYGSKKQMRYGVLRKSLGHYYCDTKKYKPGEFIRLPPIWWAKQSVQQPKERLPCPYYETHGCMSGEASKCWPGDEDRWNWH